MSDSQICRFVRICESDDFAGTVERKLRREIFTNPQGTPEPATLIGLFGLGAFGITSNLKRNQKQSVKC